MTRPIGIYEKATPKHFNWLERLQFAKELGFDFVESAGNAKVLKFGVVKRRTP